jgi:hydrogenase maturation protease
MNASRTKRRLLLAIGNSARQDDGLGWAFAERLEQEGGFGGRIQYRYQLQVEDAELIKDYDEVYFVDASKEGNEQGYSMRTCEAALDTSFSSHAVSPNTILYLCNDLYNHHPFAKLIVIEGEEWGLEIGLSAKASKNLKRAHEAFTQEYVQV